LREIKGDKVTYLRDVCTPVTVTGSRPVTAASRPISSRLMITTKQSLPCMHVECLWMLL